jgi:hypothetical protein
MAKAEFQNERWSDHEAKCVPWPRPAESIHHAVPTNATFGVINVSTCVLYCSEKLRHLKEEYWEGFMALHVKMMSGELNTMMNYTVCIKI